MAKKRQYYNFVAWFRRVRQEILFRILIITFFSIFVFGVLFLIVEQHAPKTAIKNFGDSLWYVIVTLSTTGYGDIVPSSGEGRLLGIIGMFVGFVITAIASGVITSLFVERKLKEGKGLKEVRLKNHIVICGWNSYGDAILQSLVHAGRGRRYDIVLINELEEEDVSRIMSSYTHFNMRYVKGNFVNEYVLKQAAIKAADSAVILADTSGSGTLQNADERTILAAMAIRSLNPKIKTCAQLIKQENEEHLKRADVDEIIIDGEFSGFLLSNAALSQGVHQLLRELLNFNYGNTLLKVVIPRSFVGKTFAELAEYFRAKKESILIGLAREEQEISLNDILSDDYSAIDEFIRRKFAEAQEFFEGEKSRANIRINPGNEYVIDANDVAFVIARDMEQVA